MFRVKSKDKDQVIDKLDYIVDNIEQQTNMTYRTRISKTDDMWVGEFIINFNILTYGSKSC